jgi:hypothetical protein
MFAETAHFEVSVPKAGYRLADAAEIDFAPSKRSDRPSGEGLVEAEVVTADAVTRYRPDDEEGGDRTLFLKFARLNLAEPDSLLAFANKFGVLGMGSHHRLATSRSPRQWWERLYFESLDSWDEYVPIFAQATRVHALIQAGDRRSLRQMMRWDTPKEYQDGHWFFVNPVILPTAEMERRVRSYQKFPGARHLRSLDLSALDLHFNYTSIASSIRLRVTQPFHRSFTPPAPLRGWSEDENPILVAQAWLDQTINLNARFADLFETHFGIAPGRPHRALYIVPKNLLALLWFQFARAVALNKDYEKDFKECKNCREWFETRPKDRALRIFCSDRCKMEDYRRRKGLAVDMAAKGCDLSEIAAATGTDQRTAKVWIKNSIPKRR